MAVVLHEWATYSARKQERLLRAMATQVKQQAMPLPAYTLLHTGAKPGEDQRKLLVAWLDGQLAGAQ
ncbi:hypothetical protein D3H65_00635 [Paraflavitalea soli]|uniref:Haem-binding domain-containing protein n=1 Tax=Paraflavitalea soli TaxID=2315862 RepID=A0A3B7MH81_9BACT|nr:hypothetical protein D3H65_00635 [Paraflavitalea soli]